MIKNERMTAFEKEMEELNACNDAFFLRIMSETEPQEPLDDVASFLLGLEYLMRIYKGKWDEEFITYTLRLMWCIELEVYDFDTCAAWRPGLKNEIDIYDDRDRMPPYVFSLFILSKRKGSSPAVSFNSEVADYVYQRYEEYQHNKGTARSFFPADVVPDKIIVLLFQLLYMKRRQGSHDVPDVEEQNCFISFDDMKKALHKENCKWHISIDSYLAGAISLLKDVILEATSFRYEVEIIDWEGEKGFLFTFPSEPRSRKRRKR